MKACDAKYLSFLHGATRVSLAHRIAVLLARKQFKLTGHLRLECSSVARFVKAAASR